MERLQDRVFLNYSINGQIIQVLSNSKTFLKTYKFLQKSQKWSGEQLESYQLDQLKKLLHYSYENVPYYRRIFDELNMKPGQVGSLEDLRELPFLTKEIIQKNIDDLKARNYKSYKFEKTVTGGSTGFPLHFYVEKSVWLSRGMAYSQIMMDKIGCHLWDKFVNLHGAENVCEYQMFGRILVLSSFHMTDENLHLYVEKIRKLKPKFLMGYPSAFVILANYMKNNNIEPFRSLKALICYGESTFDWQKHLLKDVFKCGVHDQYGMREQVVFAGTCERGNLHVFPEYGITELIDKNGKPVTKEGEMGEIVGTGFHTAIFPFIRYKTGDLGVYTSKKCGCGRNSPLLLRIEGRLQDLVVSRTKRLVPIVGTYGLVGLSSRNVKECQLYQDKEGEIILNIVRGENYTDKDAQRIKDGFEKRFGDEFRISIQYVENIPRTNRGKFKFLIQKLPIQFGS